MNPGRHQIISRALGGGLGEHWGFDVDKALRIEEATHTHGHLVPKPQVVLHHRPAKVEHPMGEPCGLGEMLIIELKGWRDRRIQNLELAAEHLDAATAHVGIDRALWTPTNQARNSHTELISKRLCQGKDLSPVRVADHLGDAVTVAQVDEDHAAMVAPPMHPATEGDGLVELVEVEGSAVVSPHGNQGLVEVGRKSALVWAAVGGTVPMETTYFSAASTGMLKGMTSPLGIIRKNPEVGLGVVGT